MNLKKQSNFFIQALITLLILAVVFVGLAVFQEVNIITHTQRSVLDLFFICFLYFYFFKQFERFHWSNKAKRFSYFPLGLVVFDNVLEITQEFDQNTYFSFIGKNSAFSNVFDDTFLILVIISLLIFFLFLLSELHESREAFLAKSADLKEEVERRQRIEKRRRQEQQFEIVGELAGGVAHEFNNILTIIIGNLSIAAYHVNEESKCYIEKSLASAERASDLVKKLLSFSKRTQMQFSKVNLTSILDQYYKIANNAVGESTKIIIKNEDNLPQIFADESRIFFILMQLTKNSNDAIEAKRGLGGFQENETACISFDVRQKTITPEEIHPNSIQKTGDFVILTISDNGIGIPEENKSKLWFIR